MKKLIAALLFFFLATPALASNCASFSYILTNGQVADANQVMANFNNLLNCANVNLAHNGVNNDITSLKGLSTPLSIEQGGTGTTTGVPTATTTTPGISALSTSTLVIAGVDATTSVTPASLVGQQSRTTNGYLTFPGGMIIQWGLTGNISSGVGQVITYPIAFPNHAFSIQITPTFVANQGSGQNRVNSVGLTTFTLSNGSSGGGAYYWTAIGN